MGCDQSKSVRVQPVGPASVVHDNSESIEICDSGTQTKNRTKSANADDSYEYDIDKKGNKVKRRNKKRNQFSKSGKSRNSVESPSSIGDELSMESDRGLSAGSKKSADSGLGECDEYGHVITEFSNPDEVKEIEKDFGDDKDDLDLAVTGRACSKRLSSRDKSRLEESMIMQCLREEGLITKSKTESTGGVSFEIVAEDNDGMIRPPPRLAKLEKRKKKKVLTQEEIDEKLERAERRRKRKEEERLNKIREIDKSDHLAALDSFAQHRKEKGEQVVQKMDSAVDNREKRLMDIRDKIRAKERHAEEVRKRKLANIDSSDQSSCTDVSTAEPGL